MGSEARYPVRATETSSGLIEILRGGETWGVTKLAEELDISKSATHKHLRTLTEQGFVIDEGGRYRLSYKFLDIGDEMRRKNELYQIARSQINSLAEDSGELANLMIEEGGKGVYLHQARGENGVSLSMNLGASVYLHTTALGKTILAHLPSEQVDEIVAQHGLPSITEKTVSSREQLQQRLEKIRERGYAVDNEERLEGLRCVAAPIRNKDGTAVGALSVSAPTTRVSKDKIESEYPDLVCQCSNVIEIEIRY
jgi:DNA-binding IclR family transcriptional regulator